MLGSGDAQLWGCLALEVVGSSDARLPGRHRAAPGLLQCMWRAGQGAVAVGTMCLKGTSSLSSSLVCELKYYGQLCRATWCVAWPARLIRNAWQGGKGVGQTLPRLHPMLTVCSASAEHLAFSRAAVTRCLGPLWFAAWEVSGAAGMEVLPFKHPCAMALGQARG